MRSFRSVLYVPATNERALVKAASLACDAVILDLEDAVAPDEKARARIIARNVLEARHFGSKPVIVRVNGFAEDENSADLAEDLAAILPAEPHAVLFPKIRFANDAMRAVQAMAASVAPDAVRLWLMIETPQAVLDAAAIASLAADPDSRLTALVLGTNDLVKEMRVTATPTRLALLHALSTVLLAGRAYGLTVLDGVYGDLANAAGFEGEALQGKGLGFDGKTLIHPSQIEPANRIFAATETERAEAQAIVSAFEAPENSGRAVLVVNGQMVERLHYEQALRVLASRR
ncbi:MAG: CoA ester lyase [Methylobacterium sp.]|nr:MAG: CoA ester lyase [Methylobacterium sp.]